MNSYSFLLILLCFEFILNSGSGDLTIDEVKRNINLKGSIITIENRIKFKKNSLEDTFRYAVTKNNTKSLIRITAETADNKKLEMQKTSEEQDYDYYEILTQDSDEIIVKEDYGKTRSHQYGSPNWESPSHLSNQSIRQKRCLQ